jgi:hypothetical protein
MAKHPVGTRFVLGPFHPRVLRRPALTTRRVTHLIDLALAALQIAVALSAPLWARLLRRPVGQSPVAEGEEATTPTPLPTRGAEAERHINVKLFFEAPDRPGLVIEERTVAYASDISRQLRVVLAELIRGSDTGLKNPIDPATRILDVFVTARGCAYVDVSPEIRPPQGAGSQAELDTVYSIVNTLTVNFPAVTRVQILVGDRPVDTLAGHADLSRPLGADMTLLAPAALTPLAGEPVLAPTAPPN